MQSHYLIATPHIYLGLFIFSIIFASFSTSSREYAIYICIFRSCAVTFGDIWFIYFICILFNDAVSSSGCVVWND
jgi:hypothetical protein